MRSGDTLVVWKLDTLGRSLIDLVRIVDGLRGRGVGFDVLTGALSAVDTTSADGRLFFQVIAAMAASERSLIKDRTKAGLAAAKAQGRTGGRPTVITDDLLAMAKARKSRARASTP
ncbi:recombinase family protein [Streptomyces sp. ADMS]|uniref:recombinase family protein n=1 Tax=Streptomyces sp. ADMS TaxID=3071415 RepID=UPI00296EF557|nr:recombinase family protein [Streptomyces sp. ADMS]MDW4904863.1 recombinase family protein [Streptomyces sp. ADMS]